jgi:hypothetical protein
MESLLQLNIASSDNIRLCFPLRLNCFSVHCPRVSRVDVSHFEDAIALADHHARESFVVLLPGLT